MNDLNQPPAVHVENARVFLGGREILHDISWKVEQGERCFVLGANGAGKTTLVRMLMGYAWPVYGAKVSVLGKTFGQVNLSELRKSIAWVSPLMHRWLAERDWTGMEMVLSGLDGTIGLYRKTSDEERSRAMEMLGQLHAERLAERTVQTMSSGEQVRVLIARALMTQPRLMILDEPCVYLDIAGRELLLRAIQEFADTRPELTIVFITQRIEDILPVFDRGMILKEGQICAEGKREVTLTEENLRRAFGLNIRLVKTKENRFWTVIE